MNPFTSFNFSGLIKTFLPGFLIAGALIWICQTFGVPVANIYQSNKEVALLGLIVGGITLGLFSNTLVFMVLNDLCIRSRHKKKHAEFYVFEAWVQGRTVASISGVPKSGRPAEYADYVDHEALMIDKDRLPLLTYWLERYWFYMEFDLNMIVATSTITLGAIAHLVMQTTPSEAGRAFVVGAGVVLASGLVIWLLYAAAARNFDRHKRKVTSLQLAAVRDWKPPTPDITPTPAAAPVKAAAKPASAPKARQGRRS